MEALLYVEVNLVCIAILFAIFIRDYMQRNNDSYHILFTRVLFSNIGLFCADIAWGLLAFSKSTLVWANWGVNIIYFSMSGVVSYYWLDFIEKMINHDFKIKKIRVFLRLIPVISLIVLSVTSIKTHSLFFVDETGQYQRGNLYILQPLLAYFLPVYATVRAIVATTKTKNFEDKRMCRSLATFYILPAIGGICQIILKGTPMLNIGIAMSGLWIYFSFQDNEIMHDSLTSMNNRRSFDKTLYDMTREIQFKADSHLWLILMDVDYFKKINDGFGHAEGDRALITIGKVLKETCGLYNCFVARIGGDEFAICCESSDVNFPDLLCQTIHDNLFKASSYYPFKLKLSVGFAEYDKDISPQQLFLSADKELYKSKGARTS